MVGVEKTERSQVYRSLPASQPQSVYAHHSFHSFDALFFNMRSGLHSLTLLGLLPLSFAAPAPTPASLPQLPSFNDAQDLQPRQLIQGTLNNVLNVVDGALDDVKSAVAAGNPTAVISGLLKIQPTIWPTDIPDAMAKQSSVWASPTKRTDFYVAVATQVANGLILDGTLKTVLTGGITVGENSANNTNSPSPSSIFPKKDQSDAPYTVAEEDLRGAIYIPKDFTYGAKPPTLFVQGTGGYAGTTFGPNLRKLLTGKPYADPVWVNIPNAMLSDAQTNAEYVAYAINYISAVSKNSEKISVVAWSQGGPVTQWALKYWPSTRRVVKNFFPVSADFRGTVLTNIVCLSTDSQVGQPLCAPSLVQQERTSKFLAALQRDNGGSAYVPTTSFYSSLYDEVVQPQSGTDASAFMSDARGVGVANIEVQNVCSGQFAGSVYGHAEVLFNPLTHALIVDALTHDGPGNPDRIDLKSVCTLYAADGLDLDDAIATIGLIPVAGLLILASSERTATEPPLRAYAM